MDVEAAEVEVEVGAEATRLATERRLRVERI